MSAWIKVNWAVGSWWEKFSVRGLPTVVVHMLVWQPHITWSHWSLSSRSTPPHGRSPSCTSLSTSTFRLPWSTIILDWQLLLCHISQFLVMRRRVPSELTTNRLSWNYEYWVEACAVRTHAAPVVVVVVGRTEVGLSLICPVHGLNITCNNPPLSWCFHTNSAHCLLSSQRLLTLILLAS